jgi:hypothetical protein
MIKRSLFGFDIISLITQNIEKKNILFKFIRENLFCRLTDQRPVKKLVGISLQ